MLSDEWLSRYGLLENFNASVKRTRTRTGTRTGTGTWTTGVTAIALCTSCSRAKNDFGVGCILLARHYPVHSPLFPGNHQVSCDHKPVAYRVQLIEIIVVILA